MTSAIAGMESRSIDLINKIKNNPSTRNIKNFIKNVTAIKNNFGHLFGVIKIKITLLITVKPTLIYSNLDTYRLTLANER